MTAVEKKARETAERIGIEGVPGEYEWKSEFAGCVDIADRLVKLGVGNSVKFYFEAEIRWHYKFFIVAGNLKIELRYQKWVSIRVAAAKRDGTSVQFEVEFSPWDEQVSAKQIPVARYRQEIAQYIKDFLDDRRFEKFDNRLSPAIYEEVRLFCKKAGQLNQKCFDSWERKNYNDKFEQKHALYTDDYHVLKAWYHEGYWFYNCWQLTGKSDLLNLYESISEVYDRYCCDKWEKLIDKMLGD